MPFHQNRRKLNRTIASLCLIVGALSACSTVGPISISRGRGDYNEAIKKTDDQQMLMEVVQRRYGESSNLLAVSTVTANVRFTANAGVQVGYGRSENYTGNLVPFSGGVSFEENPTITYAPVQGDKYLRQLLSPIPLDIVVMSLSSSHNPGFPLTMLVKRIDRAGKQVTQDLQG